MGVGVSSDERTYLVVRNHEEQYSIWPAGQDVPAGWAAEGFEGPKSDCLAHIAEVWTDLRPLSLRRAGDDKGAERVG
ncbi:MbtH family protein [Streptomyces sp. NRRL S-340]|uniref:MbtH family protein n=1 Tax=Streptomyces sp. NRRL S-340 TaxID=1463901 RepID=UPI00055E83DB|nr:MbtH family NRPS accessory protein [Streptomyces sp. NRRL S-340]